MKSNEQLLTDTIERTIAIYSETRHRTEEEKVAASRELRCYLPILIEQDMTEPIKLTTRALRHLRELERRPRPVPRRSSGVRL